MIIMLKEILVLKISQSWRKGMTPNELYNATRRSWKLSANRIANIDLVLCVAEKEVREAYTVDQWILSEDEGRKEFIGHVASQEVRELWVGIDSSEIEAPYGVARYIAS
tara:strand:+ start:170 stop:496 length:327 start_codon:yes stop_codon:yes gene_type:complete